MLREEQPNNPKIVCVLFYHHCEEIFMECSTLEEIEVWWEVYGIHCEN